MGSWRKLSEQMREEYIGDRDNLCIARSGVFISTCNSMGGWKCPTVFGTGVSLAI